jgi:RNA polymerase sigma-70 factor (ECF subfamily)
MAESELERAEPAPAVEGKSDLAGEHAAVKLLVARYLRGDRNALAELVVRHESAVLTHAARIVGDIETAHDVAQEAFIRVIKHCHQWEGRNSFRSWLLAIVRNLSIDVLRRRHATTNLDDRMPAPTTAASAQLEAKEVRQRVARILMELPDKYREILIMRELEDIPAESIAQLTKVDYGTTRWRLHQARQLFRAAWIARFGEDVS